MTCRPTRTAVSLLELLVVIAIIGVLLALLLPAIQRVRHAAMRTTCLNNLKQIGLASLGYHDAHGVFPPGVSVEKGRSPQPFLSWNARLLPFLERESLWQEILASFAKDRDFLNVPPHTHRSTIIATFACPADTRTLGTQIAGFGRNQVAFTAYLGNGGSNYIAKDGILFIDSHVCSADVKDGMSNTLLVGERPPSADGVLGWWYAGWGQSQDGSAEMVLGTREINVYESTCWRGPYSFGPGSITNQCDAFHFWSMHPGGGAHFLFADGSVHFLAYAAASVLPALATRAGGEAASLPD